MHVRDAGIDDLPAIRELVADANDTPYDLARVAAEKCFDAGPYGPPTTLVAATGSRIDGVIAFTPRGIRIVAVRRTARRRGIGSELLRRFEADAGEGKVVVYGEAGNYYLPGVPEPDAATRRFFESHGYVAEDELPLNLTVELRNNPALPDPGTPGAPQLDSAATIERASESSRDELLEFVASRFGGIWSYETERALRNDPPTAFLARNGAGRIAGFSAHEANNRGLGFFGPMGTDPEARGGGVGRALLLASLADLRERGFAAAVISWAANVPFYERACGARPSLRMVRFSKVL
jgi:GNAT superfamily N-acetyltransferase